MNRVVCLQKWHCEQCGVKTIRGTAYEAHEDAGTIVARVEREHRETSSECRGRVWLIDRERDFAKGRTGKATRERKGKVGSEAA